MADFDEMLPEEADEQNQRLMHDLRRIYSTDTQTIEHLAHMRQRLLANDDSSAYNHESTQHSTLPTLQHVQSSTRNAKPTNFAVAEERSWQSRLGGIAAVLLRHYWLARYSLYWA